MIRFSPVPDRKFLWGHLWWFLSWVVVTGFAIYLRPKPIGNGTHTELGLPPCPSATLLHRPCPGCGLTTSFTAFVHGDWALSFHAHPLGPILYGLFTITALMCGYGWLTKRMMDTNSKSFNWGLATVLVVFFAFGVARFAMMDHYGEAHPLTVASAQTK